MIRRRMLAASAAALLLLAACGSDEDDTSTGEDPGATEEPDDEPADADEGEPDDGATGEGSDPLAGTAAEEPVADGSFAEAPAGDGTSAEQPAGDGIDAVEAAEDPAIGLASAGLIVLDGERLVDGLGFEAEQADVLEVMEVVTGERPDAEALPSECGFEGETRTYEDLALTVTFSDGLVTGWYVNDAAAPRTVNDVGIGSTIAEFREAIPSTAFVEGGTSLGDEFTSDAGYTGIASSGEDASVVEALWAGQVCTIR